MCFGGYNDVNKHINVYANMRCNDYNKILRGKKEVLLVSCFHERE